MRGRGSERAGIIREDKERIRESGDEKSFRARNRAFATAIIIIISRTRWKSLPTGRKKGGAEGGRRIETYAAFAYRKTCEKNRCAPMTLLPLDINGLQSSLGRCNPLDRVHDAGRNERNGYHFCSVALSTLMPCFLDGAGF